MVECLEDLLKVFCTFLFAEPIVLRRHYLFKEILPLNIFHDKVNILLVSIGFVVGNYVGVIKLLKNINLMLNGIITGPPSLL